MKWLTLVLVLAFGIASASESSKRGCKEDCGDGGTGIGIGTGGTGMGGDGGAGGRGGNVGDIGIGVEASGIGEGGDAAGGSSTVNTESRSTSIVLGNAQDTAECFTKVQLGSEWLGIGFSRSDRYCKKVRRIFRMLQLERFDAAAKLECTLTEWSSVYGWNRKEKRVEDWEDCQIDVRVFEMAPPMVAQVAAVDYEQDREAAEEQAEQVEYRQAQQQNKIDSLEQRAEKFGEREAILAAEIERLRIEAEAREKERLESRARLAESLQQYKVPEK